MGIGFDCGKLRKIDGDIRTTIPWVATVFVQKSPLESYNFVATGTILSPSTVLTIFPGPYGNSTYPFLPRESIFVIGGTNTSLPTLIDHHTQLRQVNYILPYNGHSERDNQNYHYVLLHLKTPFNLTTPYIRRICLPPLGVPKVVRDASASIYDTKLSGIFGPLNERSAYVYGVKKLQIN